jgi:hypothetical protein
MSKRVIVLLLTLSIVACANGAQVATPVEFGAQAAASQSNLYVYSPDGVGALLTYPPTARGATSPSTILSGSNTKFVGGTTNLFGGGISIASDGTIYVFDATRALVLTFAAGSHGNAAPASVERLPTNDNAQLKIPQYAGFALDTAGNFWTADRTNGNLDEFRLGGKGAVKALTIFKPSVREGKKFVPGVASTVASDGEGNIYCICQPNSLFLQLYCITQYDVTGAAPKLLRSIYGILGNLDTQVPATVLHVDPRTKTAYVGIWKPAAVVEYPADAPSGPAPAPHVIGGVLTTLDAVPAAVTTDSLGRVYVAQGSAIAVFAAGATGNVRPVRIIRDPKNLQFGGYAYGDLLAITGR